MKDEVVKSVPFTNALNDKIKELSNKLGVSGNKFVQKAVEHYVQKIESEMLSTV